MADRRAYFKLDIGYLTNPKIAAISEESPFAVLLHIGAIAYSAQHLTDGLVPLTVVRRMVGASLDDVSILERHGVLIDRGHGQHEVKDFLEHQRSSAEAKRATDKASRAAATRWAAEQTMLPSMLPGMPPSMLDASESSMPRERERERERTTTSPASQAVSEFASWYAHYPRKTGKAAAEKAFIKALKTTELETLMAGVIRYARDPNLPEKQFIPHPSKWLNDGRWDDDPLPPKTGGATPPPKPAGRDDWMYR